MENWFLRRLSKLAFIASTSHNTLPPFITYWSSTYRSRSLNTLSGLAMIKASNSFTRLFMPGGLLLKASMRPSILTLPTL